MVKVTTSMIDVYSNAGVYPRDFQMPSQHHNQVTTNNLARHFRSHSLDAAELITDTSDSETSFFDDSDDNDEVTAFFGRRGQEFCPTKNLKGVITTRDVCENNKINDIWRRSIKERNNGRSMDCEMLLSPRIQRKNITSSIKIPNNRTHKRTITADGSIFENLGHSHVRNYSVPNLTYICTDGQVEKSTNGNNSQNSSRSPSPTEEELIQRNSFFLSPRLKRKQIDITKSPAYKEIYTHNLRLYSAVLAKQIATSSQVGREMNEIRRNKLKERALSQDTTSTPATGFYRRSKSFGNGVSSLPESQECKRERRSQSANAEYLKNQIRQNYPTELKTVPSQECLAEKKEPLRHKRSYSLPSKELIQTMSGKITPSCHGDACNNDDNSDVVNDSRDKRTIAACRRKEELKKKLDSFDLMFGKTTDFLTKVKTMKK